MDRPTFAQLRCFVAAYESASMSGAARRLAISQASASEHVSRLEENLNALLFTRVTRGLKATAAADALLPHARAALAAVDAGASAVRALSALEEGVVSFGVLRYASAYGLSDLAHRFHVRYPNVQIRMVGVNSDFVAERVRDGTLEAGIVVLPVDATGLTVKPNARDEVLFASTTRRPEDGPVTVEEIARTPLVLFDADAGPHDPTRRQVTERLLREGIDPVVSIEVELADTAAQLVAAGVGASFFARNLTESHAFPTGVHLTPLDPPLYDTIAIVTRRDAYLSAATLRFARMAEAAIINHFTARSSGAWRV